MTRDEYINSLSLDELRAVVREFWGWIREDCCPKDDNADFPCDGEQDYVRSMGALYLPFSPDKCNKCYDSDQEGCEVKYAVWKFRKDK